MKMKIFLMLILIFSVSNVYARESVSVHTKKRVMIHDGFGSGVDFLKMGEMQRYTYVLGAVNGMLVAPFFGAPMERMNWFESYIETMDINQTVDLLAKYIRDNPDLSKDGLNTLLYMAIRKDYKNNGSHNNE